MKSFLIVVLMFINVIPVLGQNPKGFDSTCDKYISKTVPLVYAPQLYGLLKKGSIVVLDAREKPEYEVSHIYKAKFIGYDNFNIESISDISKSDTVYIYCSIGYRSEKIGEKLQKAGYKNVFNLYGGIFNWVNSGYKVFDHNSKHTPNVHGFDKEWSRLLNNKRCSVNLDQ